MLYSIGVMVIGPSRIVRGPVRSCHNPARTIMTDPWTPERIAALKSLWDGGLSTREIGLKLGITKNAVVGKAHRMGLSKSNAPVAAPPPVVPFVRLETLGAGMCCWPDGEPGTPELRFCGKPSLAEKPYCAEHCERAYVRGGKDTSNTVAARVGASRASA